MLVRFFTRDDEAKAAAVFSLLSRAECGKEALLTSPFVVFETVFTLQKSYGVARSQIRSLLTSVLTLRNLELVDKSVYLDALDLFAATTLSFADAFNATYMRSREVDRLYSWDEDFDRLPWLERIEPGDDPAL